MSAILQIINYSCSLHGVETLTSKKENEVLRINVRPLRVIDLHFVKTILWAWIKNGETSMVSEEVKGYAKSMWESVFDKPEGSYFVAETKGKVMGVIGLKEPGERMKAFATSPNPVELVNAYVDPEYIHGKGMGTALVAKVEEEARKMGKTEIILNSGPRYKETSWGFYDRLEGFCRVGVIEDCYGPEINAPVWQKLLVASN